MAHLMPMASLQRNRSHGGVLRFPAMHAVTPQAQCPRLQLLTQQGNDRGFVQPKLGLDRIEGGRGPPQAISMTRDTSAASRACGGFGMSHGKHQPGQ